MENKVAVQILLHKIKNDTYIFISLKYPKNDYDKHIYKNYSICVVLTDKVKNSSKTRNYYMFLGERLLDDSFDR